MASDPSAASPEPVPPAAIEPVPAAHAAEQPPGALSNDDKQWGMFAHLSAVIAGLFGLSFLGPLIIWLIKKDQSKFVDYHGKEALNFQLNILVYMLIAFVITIITCGLGVPLMIAVGIYSLVMAIIAGVKANKGEMYQYPATVRVLK